MPDLWMDVDIALAEVPVNLFPLLDDTDFKTREVAVAYNAAGMDLVWNFVTTGGAMTQTAVTPTTSGDYDWAHQGDGMYSIEITASGGASINNDTEGFGWFTGIATGVLPWRGPVIGFRAAGLNDLLIDSAYSTTRGLSGTALPAVAAEGAGGLYTRGTGAGQLSQAANGELGVVTLTKTLTTYTGDTPQTGDSFARLGAPAGASVSADILVIDNFVDNLESRVGVPSDLGSGATLAGNNADISNVISVVNADTDDIQAKIGTPAGASLAADIAAIEAQTDDIGVAGAGLTALASQASVNTIDDFLDTEIAAILAAVDTEIAAIKAVTDLLIAAQAEPTGVPAANETPLEKLGFLFEALRNKLTVTATKMTFFDDADAAQWEKDLSDDSTTYTESEGNSI